MSKKLQITVSDEVYDLLEGEANIKGARILTYAAILLSEYILDRTKKKRFNDEFG